MASVASVPIIYADSIEADSQSTGVMLLIEEIRIEGNAKTKSYVLFNEMGLHTGDLIPALLLEQIIQTAVHQLQNTSLFQKVELNYERLGGNRLIINVSVEERWYVFPVPVFELADRNFNTWWSTFDHDITRVNIGLNLIMYNTSGHHDDLEMNAQWGFTPKFEVFYKRPYVGKSQKHGMGVFFSAAANKKVPYTTADNTELFLDASKFNLERYRGGLQYFLRDGLFKTHTLEVKYNYNSIADTIAVLNPRFFGNGKTRQQFATITYDFLYNRVDSKAYPLSGIYSSVKVRKIGLGFSGDVDQWSIIGRHTQFFDLGKNFYAAYQLKAKSTMGNKHPYYNLEGLGYCQDLVRGYELYVIDGQHYAFGKFNLKHKLFEFELGNPVTKDERFERIPFTLYLKAYYDGGYVADNYYAENNPLTNKWLNGYGFGLDVVTFYDWVFRFEYSFNSLGENGLFLHFVLDLNTYEDCNLW